MKQRLLLFAVLIASFTFGWASSIDSIGTKQPISNQFLNGISEKDTTGGLNVISNVSVDELITPGSTAEASSLYRKYIKVNRVAKGKLRSDDVWVLPEVYYYESISAIFVIETLNIKKYTLELVGKDKNMFKLDAYSLNAGMGTRTRGVTLTYIASSPGAHAVSVVIKEKAGLFSSPKSYTLTVVCQTLSYSNSIPNPFDDSLNDSNEMSAGMAWGNTCSVKERSVDATIYSEGQSIVIESAVEQDAIICDINGRSRCVRVYPGRNDVPVQAGGIHIIKVGEKTAKLLIR